MEVLLGGFVRNPDSSRKYETLTQLAQELYKEKINKVPLSKWKQIKVNIVANTRNSWYRAIEKLKGFLKSSLNGENTLNFFESVRSIPEFRSKSDEEIVECMENMFKKIKERKVKTTIFSNIYHKRAPYRKAIKGLDIDQILELELDEGESMGSLRFMIEKAAKEVGRQIQSGETRDGTLLIWLLPDSAKI